jgi:hypothetical protein
MLPVPAPASNSQQQSHEDAELAAAIAASLQEGSNAGTSTSAAEQASRPSGKGRMGCRVCLKCSSFVGRILDAGNLGLHSTLLLYTGVPPTARYAQLMHTFRLRLFLALHSCIRTRSSCSLIMHYGLSVSIIIPSAQLWRKCRCCLFTFFFLACVEMMNGMILNNLLKCV